MSCVGKQQQQQLVLAHVLCQGGRTSNFYVFDLEANKVLETPVATLHQIGKAGIVRLGSLVYVVGGQNTKIYVEDYDDDDDDDDSQLVNDQGCQYGGTSYFELSKPHLLSLLNQPDTPWHSVDHPVPLKSIFGSATWMHSPALSHALQVFPLCATLGGKIYALRASSTKECIGEVFTPNSHEWKCISPPPGLPLERFLVSSVIPDEMNHRLLVHFTWANVLYAYYPANGNWDCLDSNFGSWWFSATALVDGVLYFHQQSPKFLVAYDVMTKSWLKVVHSPCFPVAAYRLAEFIDMLHFGNHMLCLAHSGFVYTQKDESLTTRVQFAKFRVKRANRADVHVTHDSFNSFSFENTLRAFDFIAI